MEFSIEILPPPPHPPPFHGKKTFVFHFFGPNILKEEDINFIFKVLAKFGDYKHNKDIKKMFFFHRRGGGVKFRWKIP